MDWASSKPPRIITKEELLGPVLPLGPLPGPPTEAYTVPETEPIDFGDQAAVLSLRRQIQTNDASSWTAQLQLDQAIAGSLELGNRHTARLFASYYTPTEFNINKIFTLFDPLEASSISERIIAEEEHTGQYGATLQQLRDLEVYSGILYDFHVAEHTGRLSLNAA